MILTLLNINGEASDSGSKKSQTNNFVIYTINATDLFRLLDPVIPKMNPKMLDTVVDDPLRCLKVPGDGGRNPSVALEGIDNDFSLERFHHRFKTGAGLREKRGIGILADQ